jgi:low affinity Fe/Cu permease
MNFSRVFGRFANATAKATGSPWAFILCIVVVVVWAVSGPIFHYSDTWQLVINTGTTIITFLMVFLIQNTQNRDGSAIQAKLDDLILTSQADDEFIGIENLTDKELDALHRRCADAASASHAILERVDAVHKKRKAKMAAGGTSAFDHDAKKTPPKAPAKKAPPNKRPPVRK